MKLKDKIILITGGNAGIGAEMARQLSKQGAKIIISGRNEETLKQVAAECGVDFIQCDVTKEDDQNKMLSEITARYGKLDILINNAGIMHKYDFANDEKTLSHIRSEIEVNTIAPLNLTYKFLPLLKKSSEPAVVFVSSGLAYVPFPATPVYSGTKALMHHCAQTLRHQFKSDNIKVFELLPPATDTALADNFRTPSVKLMPVDKMVAEFVQGLKCNTYEIAAGMSKQMRLMSRIAPNFLFKQLANTFK